MLEGGKYYKNVNGDKVGPLVAVTGHSATYFEVLVPGNPWKDLVWNKDGTAFTCTDKNQNLVSEWKETPETSHKISVMQAYERGEKIRVESKGTVLNVIDKTCGGEPLWQWGNYDYSIYTPDVEDYIDWSHVSSEYKFMARDQDGSTFLYANKPTVMISPRWVSQGGEKLQTTGFSSYKQGNKDWKNSLVMRPK